MTHILNLVSGAVTVTLNSAAKKVRNYTPVTPALDDDTLDALLNGSLSAAQVPHVTESAVIIIQETSVALLITAIHTLEKILMVDAPRRLRTGQGPQVFVKFQPTSGSLNRSEVFKGSLTWTQDSIRETRWGQFVADVTLAWERQYFWEADAEVQLTLTNGNGTDNTTGLPVYNTNDGSGSSPTKRHNYAEIDAAEALSPLPAPLRLAVTNTYGTALRRLYVALKAQGTPASFTHILEAESATLGTGVASAVDAASSNGNTANVTNVPAAERTLFTFAISSAQAAFVLSQWIRTLLRFSTLPNDATLYMRLTLKDTTSGAMLSQTPWQLMNTADYLQPLPPLMLSPNLQGQAAPGALQLVLSGKDAAGTVDFGLDFIALLPIEAANGFRFLRPIDEALVNVPATTGLITDDGITGAIYVESTQGTYRGYGGPLMLIPGVLQRLYFLCDGSGDAAIARSLSIKAFYRPRVLTV